MTPPLVRIRAQESIDGSENIPVGQARIVGVDRNDSSLNVLEDIDVIFFNSSTHSKALSVSKQAV
jgi:hypothetical protein